MQPRLVDYFCGAGGCSVGYARAGFQVRGVDIEDHPSYPFIFTKGDALKDMRVHDYSVSVKHASPPCQHYTRASHLRTAQGKVTDKSDHLEATRELLKRWAEGTDNVYIIENVPGAPLENPVLLCGSAFGLKVRRHRLFESNIPLVGTVCDHKTQGRPVGIYGSMKDNIPQGGRTAHSIEEAREAMGIDWMQWRSNNQEWNDLKEAIPPSYTEFIGRQVMAHLKVTC